MFYSFAWRFGYYATGSNYSVIGDFQGVTKSTVCRAIREVTEFLYSHQQEFIEWPQTSEALHSKARDFYLKFSQKPFVLGCVDGTHVALIAPAMENGHVYVNRKQYHSLNVMVIWTVLLDKS